MAAKISELCEMEKRLVEAAQAELSKGVENVDTKEFGEVIDMIKDLAETKKFCMEAHYYKLVSEAMEDAGEMPEVYPEALGYRNSRRMGYRPMVDQEPYIYDYLRGNMNGSSGYGDGRNTDREDWDGRHSRAYNEYRMARRHYTQTNSPSDKEEMAAHANEHVMETIATMRDIWKNAEPEHRKRMKQDIQNLLNEMT